MAENKSEKGSFWTTLPGILTGCGGVIVAITGLVTACLGVMNLFANSTPSSTPSVATEISKPNVPTEISKHSAPNTDYIVINNIQLPQEPDISDEVRKAAATLIVNADKAEILANYYQDDSYLKPYYTGSALEVMQQNIEKISQSGYIQIDDLDLKNSYYISMRLNSKVLSIDECEYWKTYLYDPSTQKLASETAWTLVPQTISMEAVGGQVYITAISFYQNNAFCTK